MPRRKQVKPQHIKMEDQGKQRPQQPALKLGDVAPAVPAARGLGAPMNLGTGDEMSGDQVMVKRPHWEETHICEKCCGEFFGFSQFLEHQKYCIKHPPVLIMSDSEGLVPLEDFSGAMLSHQAHGPISKGSHREGSSSSGNRKKQPGMESVLYSNKETALPSPPQDLSYLPRGKVTSTNVTLQALQGTTVAVNQRRADALPSPQPCASNIPWVLEQILYLQQQQLQQIQLTEQIRIQVNMWAAHVLHSSEAGADHLTTLGSHVSQQISAAVALLTQKAGSQSLPLDTLKQAKLPHTNIPSTTSSMSPGLVSFALRPDESRVLPNHLPGALLPQAPSSVLFQSPFSTVALDLSKKGKEKPPNMPPVGVIPKDQAALYRHVCKYCGKVFGTDSSLQIHLRSHTGERPFMCSVCGHGFTTEDSLKVHFYQHLQVKANPQQFAEFHNKMTTGNDAPYALSVPVPVGESSLSLESTPVLVTGNPNVGLPQNLSWGTNPKDLKSGPLANDLQLGPFPESEDGSVLSAVGPNHNSQRVSGFPGGGTPEPGSETLKLQQLVENIDKATTDPNTCLICHRAFSCQSALRMHYRTHTEQRPFRCRICDRAFSTKGNLKTHLEAHQTNTSIKTQYSCPICQKKFTNAIMLQQHVRMHMGGQIPNTPLPENPCDTAGPELMVGENSTSATCHDTKRIDVDEVGSQDAPSSSTKVPMPLSSAHVASPTLGLITMTPLDAPGKAGPAPLVQQQSSRGKGLVESGGLINDSLPSVTGDPEYQGRNPEVLETMPFQAASPVKSQAESLNPKSDGGGKAESSENNCSEMEGWSSVQAQPTYVKVGGAFESTTVSPGMTPLLVGQPDQGKQHGCTRYRKIHSSASTLQIREQTHTGEKPFMCNTCGQAFTTKGNLQVHYRTHVDNSSAHCGREPAIDNTMDLSGADGKQLPEMSPQEIMAPSMNVDPVMWNQYTTMPNDGLAMKTNKISVIQSIGIPTPSASLGASSLVSNTPVTKIDSQRSQTPVRSLTGGKQ
ncbi:sal-like protein 4 [Pteronotus mesoamericanus]|uniref:sal-like protein 4 n=1 Tax=Pteronotus mesoamericanus TaxID=1884717 RepID=UPI0023EB6954|nr:sal-like protein 4 [Pteronotus parnellii mesoamericanus]